MSGQKFFIVFSLGSIESLNRHFVFPDRILGPMALPKKITETLRDFNNLECIDIVNKADDVKSVVMSKGLKSSPAWLSRDSRIISVQELDSNLEF